MIIEPASHSSSARSSRTVVGGPPPTPTTTHRQRTSALEANTAAWGYTKCCILFFLSMLITWVPSSVNRLYALVHPAAPPNFALSYVAGLVLPLTGFWNSIIYIVTSRVAVRALFVDDIAPWLGLSCGRRRGSGEKHRQPPPSRGQSQVSVPLWPGGSPTSPLPSPGALGSAPRPFAAPRHARRPSEEGRDVKKGPRVSYVEVASDDGSKKESGGGGVRLLGVTTR